MKHWLVTVTPRAIWSGPRSWRTQVGSRVPAPQLPIIMTDAISTPTMVERRTGGTKMARNVLAAVSGAPCRAARDAEPNDVYDVFHYLQQVSAPFLMQNNDASSR